MRWVLCRSSQLTPHTLRLAKVQCDGLRGMSQTQRIGAWWCAVGKGRCNREGTEQAEGSRGADAWAPAFSSSPKTFLTTVYPPRPPQDTNFGLVKQVLSSLTVRSIQRLTQTFLTLSLPDIAVNAGLGGPGEAEARILQ